MIGEDKAIGEEVKEMTGMSEVLEKAEEKDCVSIVAFQDILQETAESPKEEERVLEEAKERDLAEAKDMMEAKALVKINMEERVLVKEARPGPKVDASSAEVHTSKQIART